MRAIRALCVGAAAFASAGAIAGATTAQAAETASQSFVAAGEQAFTIPAGVTSVQVLLVGGHGGASGSGLSGAIAATASATIAVTPGETLFAEVAGDGEPATVSTLGFGGYGGGGSGGEVFGLFGGVPSGGGGGGASDVRTCSATAAACQSLSSRLVVAAGGAGSGNGSSVGSVPVAGGPGGAPGFAGQNGASDGFEAPGKGGAAATASSGGTVGEGGDNSSSGMLGKGGDGGEAVFIGGGGGGGGGGIYGGGGGGAGLGEPTAKRGSGGGGGGGGSSGVPAGAAGVSLGGFSLLATGPGAEPQVTFTWTRPAPAVITGAPSALASSSATLNGTINPDGSQITDCHFTIAPGPAGGTSIPCSQQIGAGSTAVAVSAAVTGLSPATSYAVTLVASSAQGTSSGSPVSFASSSANASSATGSGSALTVKNLTLSPTRLRRGKHTATIAKAKSRRKRRGLPSATTISFTLSSAATVTLTFQAADPGVLHGRKCVAPGKAHRRARSCKRYVSVSGAVRRGAHAGADRIHFDGLLDGGRSLPLGTYRLTLAASAPPATITAAAHPTFTLLP